ncbi:MAG: sigma-70 family RNA polymerase sigma factor [Isosphaeraceae bacterium]
MKSATRGPVLRELDRLFRCGTLSGLGDDELLQRFLDRRDGSAFEALVSLHGPMVLGICRRMLHDPRDVEDAFQATFLVLVRKACTIRERGLLSSWLYGVAYRVAHRARAQAIERQVREIGVERLDAHAGSAPPERAEIGPVLDQELSRLPARYREPLVLCYLEGRTHDQAAEQLRCPVGTVRSRMARGRDLLKRRLTRRGYAPTAAILGGGASVPAVFVTESIPAALLSTTVRSALGHATLRSAMAGAVAAPILTLTQGVLTTMKLSQLAWIGLAMLATSLSAGGLIAVAFARAQTAGSATALQPSGERSAEPAGGAQAQSPGARPQTTSEAFDARLRALESKIDLLLSRSTPSQIEGEPLAHAASTSATTTATHSAVVRPARAAAKGVAAAGAAPAPAPSEAVRPPVPVLTDLTWASNAPATVGTVRELETQLKLALQAFDRSNALYRNGSVPQGVLEQTRGKVLLAAAVLEGLDDDLADELDRLRLEMKKKTAELHQAQAQREVAASVVARNARLNQRKPGMVSDDDVAKADAELKIAEAQIEAKRAEVEEISLLAARATRRRDRIAQAIRLSARATAEARATSEPTSTGGLAPPATGGPHR